MYFQIPHLQYGHYGWMIRFCNFHASLAFNLRFPCQLFFQHASLLYTLNSGRLHFTISAFHMWHACAAFIHRKMSLATAYTCFCSLQSCIFLWLQIHTAFESDRFNRPAMSCWTSHTLPAPHRCVVFGKPPDNTSST
jgi:hypothetical protein